MFQITKYILVFLINFILNKNLNLLATNINAIFGYDNNYDQNYNIPNTFTIQDPINVLKNHFSSDDTCQTNRQNLISQTTSTNRILHELMNTMSFSSYSSETSPDCAIASSIDYTSSWTDTDTTQMIHLRNRYYQCCFEAEMNSILSDISPSDSNLRNFMMEFHSRLMYISEYILHFTDAFSEYSQNDVTNLPKFIQRKIRQVTKLPDIYNYKEFFVSELQTKIDSNTETQDLENLYLIYQPWIQFIHNCIKSNAITLEKQLKEFNSGVQLVDSFYTLNIWKFIDKTNETKRFGRKVFLSEYPKSYIKSIKYSWKCQGELGEISEAKLNSKTIQIIVESSILNDNEKNTLSNDIKSLNEILLYNTFILYNKIKVKCNLNEGKDASQDSKRLIVGLRNNNGEHFCGGVLVHSIYVLTAAHCVNELSISEIFVSVNNLYSYYNPEVDQLKAVTHVTIHPNYDSSEKPNDIAILTLENSITDENFIATLGCLPDNYETLHVLSYGWGVSTLNGPINNHLQEYGSNLIKNNHCEDALNIPINGDPNKLCAWGSFGSAVCHGDSGGPLYLYDTLIGLISYGIPCGIGYPDVYVNLYKYHNWINEKTNNLVSWICPIPVENTTELDQSTNIAKKLNLSISKKDQLLNLIKNTQNVDDAIITTESFDIEFSAADDAMLKSMEQIINMEIDKNLFPDLLKLIEIRLLAQAIDFYNITDIDGELEKVDSVDYLSTNYICNIEKKEKNNDKYLNYFNSLINANIDNNFSCLFNLKD